jgi:hypothetical protein
MTMRSPGPATTRHHTTAAGPAMRRDWRDQALCLHLDPDFMFGARARAEALHICRRHCPVLNDCQAYAQALRPAPTDCVMGGVAWRLYADRITTPSIAAQPAESCRLCRVGAL